MTKCKCNKKYKIVEREFNHANGKFMHNLYICLKCGKSVKSEL